MDDKTLLPCPFCGNAALPWIAEGAKSKDFCHHVFCSACGAEITTDPNEPKAIDARIAWNTRAPQATRIEALEAALRRMIYETTHLSPMKPNGDHDCTIKADALAQARQALENQP